MYEYQLTRLSFNDGTTIVPGNLTVIVGPNNSGKSRALREIVTKATTGRFATNTVVSDVDWALPTTIEELRRAYEVERFPNESGSWGYRVLKPELIGEESFGGGPDWPDGYETHFAAPGVTKQQFFAESFGRAMIAFLTTEHRLQLIKECDSPSHERHASNVLHTLFNSGRSAEQAIRQMVKREFGQEVALDFSVLQRLLLRVGDDFSDLPADPRDAKAILQQCEKLDEQGDGLRSFVGILVAMLSLKRSVFLIDEPEAFLHPPQAFRVGEFLAEQTSGARQIILATHSADVLRGILSKTSAVSIIRIDRIGNTNYFKPLDPDRLKDIVTDPLLSSARVLDGLFYSGAVVVEADADARFYHSVSNKRRPGINLHFVNADNKQTVPRITRLYRDMGVRCAGIVDFDVLNDRAELDRQLDALAASDQEKSEVLTIQAEIATFAKETPPNERLEQAKQDLTNLLATVEKTESGHFASEADAAVANEQVLREIYNRCRELADTTRPWKEFKKNGRSALSPTLQSRFDRLWDVCASRGLVINPSGELESMLIEYGIPSTSNKRAWIIQALQLLSGLEVNDSKYPWKLIAAIHDLLFAD